PGRIARQVPGPDVEAVRGGPATRRGGPLAAVQPERRDTVQSPHARAHLPGADRVHRETEMKAMVLKQPADVQRLPLVLGDVPVPEPGPDDVRVRVQVCGVCRTDLHIVEGELPPSKRPAVPGPEVAGIVDVAGSPARAVKAGERAGRAWMART